MQQVHYFFTVKRRINIYQILHVYVCSIAITQYTLFFESAPESDRCRTRVLSDIAPLTVKQKSGKQTFNSRDGFFVNELFFINPTSKTIKFSIENKNYELKSNCSLLVEIKDSIISIKSNCLFLRPTVFSYKDKYLDKKS